ncbi:protein phosphatase [Natranaerovirga pectinivora]|uniref:Protein phosphatase n=1 Tax=Natranaerovirga pectinivora TaxID=682400 RepID=A0A4R3MKH9_9FIRM|nr:metallophosphoesterase family protein [Natranaerovirga pectinivora]TCT14943.1 protein phosphatase [Natranaerovirga pectinivora]
MERIAIISDIHGNLPALEAVLDDIKEKEISRIICLGDMIGKGPSSLETLDICRDVSDIVIMGNWEKFVSNNPNPGDINWINELGQDRLEYIKNLPESIGFYLSGKYIRLFHAHPHNVFKRVFSNSKLEERLEMFDIPKISRVDNVNCESDIVGYGDIHGAFIDTLIGGKTLFNVGSVGNPCDHITMASYVIIEGNYASKVLGNIGIQLCRVNYNIEKATMDAKDSNIPFKKEYIKELQTAIYCNERKKN